MNSKIKKIIQSIADAETPFSQWGTVWDAVTVYAEAVVNGKNAAEMYPIIADYIRNDPEIREIYEDLRDVLAKEKAGTWNTDIPVPQFDFSFLKSKRPSIWQKVSDDVHRLVENIVLKPKAERLTFDAIPDILAGNYHRRLRPVALRAAEADANMLEEWLDLPITNRNTRIKLFTGPVEGKAGTVVLQAEKMDTSTPIAHAKVVLRDADEHLLESNLTGQDGTVTFNQLYVGKYIIQFQENDVKTEFKITIR